MGSEVTDKELKNVVEVAKALKEAAPLLHVASRELRNCPLHIGGNDLANGLDKLEKVAKGVKI